jgi:hypothetical protein
MPRKRHKPEDIIAKPPAPESSGPAMTAQAIGSSHRGFDAIPIWKQKLLFEEWTTASSPPLKT